MRALYRRRPNSVHPVVLVVLAVLVALSTLTVAPVYVQDGSAAPPRTADGAPGSLAAMLGRLSEAPLFIRENEESAIVSYADYAAQLAAVGVTPPVDMQDPTYNRWLQATRGMPPFTGAFDYMFMPEWRPSFGFDAFQVDQSAEYRGGDELMTLLRGQFDQEEVETALRDSGYEPITIGDATFLSWGEDGEFDFESPASSMTLGTMNNAVFLPDGTLAFSATRAGMQALMAVEADDAPSLADQDDVAPLVQSARPNLVMAWITSGLSFALGDPLMQLPRPGATPDLDAIATAEDERSRLPQVETALLGATAGGPLPSLDNLNVPAVPIGPDIPATTAQIGLLMLGPAAAREAEPVLEDRLATMRTALDGRLYTELFPEYEVQVPAGEPIVLIDLELGEGTPRSIRSGLWFAGDLALIEW